MKYLIFFVLIVSWSACNETSQETEKDEVKKVIEIEEHPELQSIFKAEDVIGTTVISEMETGKTWLYNKDRAHQGFLPASTFKIPNSLIALETGVITLTDTLKWNGEDHWNDNWKKDHVLATAFEVSCVPCYQEIAKKIGVERMNKHTKAMNYGKLDVNEETIENFWLTGDSRITPMEQIDFIKNIYHKTLLFEENKPFSKQSIELLQSILTKEEGTDYLMQYKTGWAQDDNINTGWVVGYLTHLKTNKVYAFATNIDRPRSRPSDGFAKARIDITRNAFGKLGIVELL